MTSPAPRIAISPVPDERRIILLKSRNAIDATPPEITEANAMSFQIAPDTIYLSSAELSSDELLSVAATVARDNLHLAVDYSAALTVIAVAGERCREVLSSGATVDLSADQFGVGMSCRTRFAAISTLLACVGEMSFELYCDRSHTGYLLAWLHEAAETDRLTVESAGANT